MAELVILPAVVGDDWNWQVNGACRGQNADLFYNPENERGRTKRIREAGAKAVCAQCPVITQCLEWALDVGESYGIWGGKSPAERLELRGGVSYLSIAD